MKAKEYAQLVIERSQDCTTETKEARVGVGIHVAMELLKEVEAQVGKASRRESQLAAYREGLTKWKAAVRIVHETVTDHPVHENYMGLLIAVGAPKIFEHLVQKNIFLGYEFSQHEKAVLETAKLEREAAILAEAWRRNEDAFRLKMLLAAMTGVRS